MAKFLTHEQLVAFLQEHGLASECCQESFGLGCNSGRDWERNHIQAIIKRLSVNGFVATDRLISELYETWN